jgi:hypothetical protein
LDNTARIRNVGDLDNLLRVLAATGARSRVPYAVDLLPAGVHGGGLQFGVGHPDRSFVRTFEPPGAFAVVKDVPAWPEPLQFDCGFDVVDFKPEWTRITPPQALEAVRHYVRTGTPPAGLHFDPNL